MCSKISMAWCYTLASYHRCPEINGKVKAREPYRTQSLNTYASHLEPEEKPQEKRCPSPSKRRGSTFGLCVSPPSCIISGKLIASRLRVTKWEKKLTDECQVTLHCVPRETTHMAQCVCILCYRERRDRKEI